MERYRVTSNLHLRPIPVAKPPSLGVFSEGTVVEGIGFNAERTWLQVRIPKGDGSFHEGWMSLRFLKRIEGDKSLPWRLGVNMREFAYYGSGANKVKFTQEGLRAQQLTACRDNGIRLVRFFASQLQFDTAQSLTFIGKALDAIKAAGMQAVICLDDSLTGAEQYMPGNNAFHTGPLGHLNVKYWRTKAYRQNYLPHVRKIVSTFANHEAVLMWELGNEFALHPQPPQPGDDAAFLEFVSEVSQEIRDRVSPNQLISLGLISTHSVFSQSPHDDRKHSARCLYALPSVDAVGVHYYRHDFSSLKEFIDIDIAIARELGKPFYVGEIGAKHQNADRPTYYAQEVSRWKNAGAFSVMPWQLDSSAFDVGIGDELGIARWRPGDEYQQILDAIKVFA